MVTRKSSRPMEWPSHHPYSYGSAAVQEEPVPGHDRPSRPVRPKKAVKEQNIVLRRGTAAEPGADHQHRRKETGDADCPEQYLCKRVGSGAALGPKGPVTGPWSLVTGRRRPASLAFRKSGTMAERSAVLRNGNRALMARTHLFCICGANGPMARDQ